MVAIYVLRLERGKYYVGKTTKNYKRIWQHIDGKGAAWTKKYPPKDGKEILSFRDGLKSSDENRITIEMMEKYGINNVRGGDWCRVKMPSKHLLELKKLVNSNKKKNGKKTIKISGIKGFCIRCRDSKDFDLEKPFCLGCYRDWQYENDDYFEEYCHACGKFCNSHLEKPVCLPCWKKNRRNKIAKISLYNFTH